MCSAHLVRDRHIILILDPLKNRAVFLVLLFRLQGRENDPAAADDRFSRAQQHISADGTDMDLHAEHIGGSVCVCHVPAGEEFNDRHAQGSGKRFDQGNIRVTPSGLPFGDCLVADQHLFRQLVLCHFPLFPKTPDHRSGYVLIHDRPPLRISSYRPEAANATCAP